MIYDPTRTRKESSMRSAARSIIIGWKGAWLFCGLVFLFGCTRQGERSESEVSNSRESAEASAATSDTEDSSMGMQLTSPAFEDMQRIPDRFTVNGEDISPPLAWSDVPEDTIEFALICDDPDAPRPDPWVHWVLYKIPGMVRELPEGIPRKENLAEPISCVQGRNSWPEGENIGYGGPAPPKGHGVHHYHFKLYALDEKLELEPGLTKSKLLEAIQGHTLAVTKLTGTYERN